MSRFMLVVPPLTGHVAPLVGVRNDLVARGHDVLWVGDAEHLRPMVGAQPVHDCGLGALPTRPPGVRGAAALKLLVQDILVPLAEAMTPAVDAAIHRFQPDVVVADQQAYAGALAADRHGIKWATSASTPAELLNPFPPKVQDWLHGILTNLRTRLGGTATGPDPRFSESLILAFTTPELAGTAAGADRPVRFVGPVLTSRPEEPWSRPWQDDAPTILITLGTVNTDIGAHFLTQCANALSTRTDLRAVIVDPGGHLGPTPDTITVAPRVPQLSVIAESDLVICHAGHNTVCEALWHGRPLIVAPIRDDQQIIAGHVANTGTGVRLRFTRTTPTKVSEAIDTTLNNPTYTKAAQRIRDSFHSAGSAAAAATHLQELASDAG
jgi:UDP:flavonoid glycosyltransferase YjiC (YdhE family)